MVAPTLVGTVLYNSISISWASITLDSFTGRSPIIYYEVRYKSSAEGTYGALTTSAIGITNSYTHTLAIGTFPNATTVYYTICAKNNVGMGACSPDLPVLACQTPSFMNPPVFSGPASIKPGWIYLTWTAISDSVSTGRSPVIFYDLMWDQASGQTTWVSLNNFTGSTMVTAFNHTIAPSVFPSGQQNYYMLRAWNNVGVGQNSTAVLVNCLLVPQRLNALGFREARYFRLNFGWDEITATADTGGDPINYYKVEWY